MNQSRVGYLEQQRLLDKGRLDTQEKEVKAELASDQLLSTAKIVAIGRESAVRISGIARESSINIRADDLNYTNQYLSARDKATLEQNQMIDLAGLKVLQYGREAAYSKAFVKQAAKASYDATIAAANAQYSAGIDIATRRVVLAKQVSAFAITCDQVMLANAIASGKAIGAAGQMRNYTRYILESEAADAVTIIPATAPTLEGVSPIQIEVPSTQAPIINTTPTIVVDESITFE